MALRIIAWLILLRGLAAYLTMLSISTDHQRAASRVKLLGLPVFIVVGFFLIKYFGYVGLSLAMVCAEVADIAEVWLETPLVIWVAEKIIPIQVKTPTASCAGPVVV